MRTILGAALLAVLAVLAGCTTKPPVREKPVSDPLFTSKLTSGGPKVSAGPDGSGRR